MKSKNQNRESPTSQRQREAGAGVYTRQYENTRMHEKTLNPRAPAWRAPRRRAAAGGSLGYCLRAVEGGGVGRG